MAQEDSKDGRKAQTDYIQTIQRAVQEAASCHDVGFYHSAFRAPGG